MALTKAHNRMISGASISVEDFGAVGDGVADDTSAIQSAVDYINLNTEIDKLQLTGTYLVDFTVLTDERYLITRGDLTICGGGTIKAKPAGYSDGVANGAFKYYHCFDILGDRVTVENLTFDGNNQFSQYASSASQPNYWLQAVRIRASSPSYNEGGKILSCRYINGSGWPFRGLRNKWGLIQGCYVEHSQGIGFDSSSLCVVANNISDNAHDAHFASWNSLGAVIANNTCDGSDNGSGIDVSGATDVTVVGNTIRDCANRGIWVVQDPNTNYKPKNVSLIGNVFFNNNTYTPISEKGDIQVGPIDVTTDSRPSGTIDCNGLTISGNTFQTFNGANCITLGKYADEVLISGNTFRDESASPAARSVSVYNATNVTLKSNNDVVARRRGSSGQPKVLGSGPVWFDGQEYSIDTSVAGTSLGDVKKAFLLETTRDADRGKTYQIEERYGYTFFGADFDAINGSVNILDIGFSGGGFVVADIEIIATVEGDRGVRKTKVVYQGYSTVTPTQIVAASDEYTGGSTPPTITLTASTGNVRISVGSNASLDGNVFIRIAGHPSAAANVTSLL